MATKGVALITSKCEATGHPSDCSEPASGTVKNDSGGHNVTVKTSDGEFMVATKDVAAMDFPSHAHDYSAVEGCHDNSSHNLDPKDGALLNITIAGSDVYPVDTDVQKDPKTGKKINITSTPGSLENKV